MTRQSARDELLILMARYPRPGRVKTRLAREIGGQAAADVYRNLLEHFARSFRANQEVRVEWRYTPPRAPFPRRFGLPHGVARPQPAGDLGERMRLIFEDGFSRGFRRVVMIGTDAPQLDWPTVRRAFHLLGRFPAVFQPAHDGGYTLVGMVRGPWLSEIFSGISWSTGQVMRQTRDRLEHLGVAHDELPAASDIDTLSDLRRWLGQEAEGLRSGETARVDWASLVSARLRQRG